LGLRQQRLPRPTQRNFASARPEGVTSARPRQREPRQRQQFLAPLKILVGAFLEHRAKGAPDSWRNFPAPSRGSADRKRSNHEPCEMYRLIFGGKSWLFCRSPFGLSLIADQVTSAAREGSASVGGAAVSSGPGPRLPCFMHMNVITNARQDREQPRDCHTVPVQGDPAAIPAPPPKRKYSASLRA
jgi:hypothetical protein